MGKSRAPQQINGLTIGLPVLITLITIAVALGTGYGVLSAYVIRNTIDIRDLRVAFGEVTNIRIDQVISNTKQEAMQRQLGKIAKMLESQMVEADPMAAEEDPMGATGG